MSDIFPHYIIHYFFSFFLVHSHHESRSLYARSVLMELHHRLRFDPHHLRCDLPILGLLLRLWPLHPQARPRPRGYPHHWCQQRYWWGLGLLLCSAFRQGLVPLRSEWGETQQHQGELPQVQPRAFRLHLPRRYHWWEGLQRENPVHRPEEQRTSLLRAAISRSISSLPTPVASCSLKWPARASWTYVIHFWFHP